MKLKNAKGRRVVVTGLGVIAPNGIGKHEFWNNSMNGRTGIHEIDRFDLCGFKSRIAGHVDDFDPKAFDLTVTQIKHLDRFALFALACAKMAAQDSELQLDLEDRTRVGVNIANAIAGTRYMEESFLEMTDNGKFELTPSKAKNFLFQSSTFNVASAVVASEFGLFGPIATTSTGCTAGIDSIGYCVDTIRSGAADIMFAGATEAPLTPIALAAFDVVGALSSKRNDRPDRASRPFDGDRDGFVLAEGCGILILEELEHAKRRNAHIYAEIAGYGSTSNAYHMTDLPPDGRDMAAAISLALADANVSANDVDYISAHGSSTRQNDANETAAFKSVFGNHAYNLCISSLKSMNGHALSAANAIESVAAILTLNAKQVPPTINYEFRDPYCDLFYVPNEGVERDINVVVKNASGFSGIHSAAVFVSEQFSRSMI
ncbi:MAG: beta-ketoacyl-[acyl-carrier-protein] synthase family protein [Gammaproteobacteria bacterium]|nr:beta-ketoacyl-[acyl-carrier-protein] synthase family protein [Gammaproteobacteria bacterium]